MKKWWESPTAALGALCGEKAEEELRVALQESAKAEYQRGYEDGKESAVVHAHCIKKDEAFSFFNCSVCDAIVGNADRYCWYCGAKMDEVRNE